MKKMLKVFVAALLAVSLMASMALTVCAEEPVEDVVEIIEEEPVFEEEEPIEEEPVVEEEPTEEPVEDFVEIIEDEPTEEPTEEPVIEEEPTEEPTEEPAEEPVVEEPVVEEPVIEEPVVEEEEEEIPFTGTVEIRMIVDNPEKALEYGDLITLEAVIALDNEGVAYRIVWEAFKGMTDESGAPVWEVVDDSDTPYYFFELTEETAAWEYRVSLMPLDAE